MANEDKTNGAGKEDKPYVPEFTVVEDTPPAKEGKESKKADGYGDDERLSGDQRADDEGGADDAEEVAVDSGDETAEQVEAKRARRRAERRAQKARQNAARNRDKTELGYLRNRNEQLERRVSAVETSTAKRLTQNELATVENRLQQLQAALVEADQVFGEATAAQDADGIAKVVRAQRELQAGIDRLTSYRDRVKATPADKEEEGEEQEGGEEHAPAARIPPGVIRNAQVFASRHAWCNLQGGDQDSDIVRAIDAAVLNEGFDPASKDYWEELEDRMRKALPHRMKGGKPKPDDDEDEDDDDDATPSRVNGGGKPRSNGHGGPRMAATSQNRGGGQKFFLTAERKQALIEAGAWEDPVLRDRYLKSFQKWDQEEAARKRGN